MKLLVALFLLPVAVPVSTAGLSGTPNGVPLATDCALRTEVWAFSQVLMPRKGSYSTMYDALQLQHCNTSSRPSSEKKWQPPRSEEHGPALTIYADANRGSDTNGSGTEGQPLQSLEAALAMVRKKRGGSGTLPSTNATILLREGVYYLRAPITLRQPDSRLTISNYGSERAEVSGGVELSGLAWRHEKRQQQPDSTVSTVSDSTVSDSRAMN